MIGDAWDEFEMPLHAALIQPVLVAGVPRAFALVNFTTTMAVAVGLHQPLVGVPLGLIAHGVALALTRRDPDWFGVLLRHLRGPRRLST